MVSPPPVQTTGEVGIHEHEALAALAQGCALRQPPGQRGPRPDGGAYGKCRGDRCEKANLVVRQIDRWIASMERLRLADYVRYVDDRKRLFWTSFFSGVARGVGMAVGFTILAPFW